MIGGWLWLLIVAIILGVVAWLVPMPPIIERLVLVAAVICGVLAIVLLLISVLGGGGVAVSSLAALAV